MSRRPEIGNDPACRASKRKRATVGRERRAVERENGSRDWRMMPVALASWTAMLIERRTFEALDGMDRRIDASACAPMLILAVLTVMACSVLPNAVARRRIRCGPAVAAAMLCAATAGLCSDIVGAGDSVTETMREGGGHVSMVLRTVSPTTRSPMRGSDCQTDANVQWLEVHQIRSPSSASVRIFADDDHCRWNRDAVYRVEGTLSKPKYGTADAWLTIGNSPRDGMTMIRKAGIIPSMTQTMQREFLAVTRGLSDQGKVLVPGLTMGVLGQEAYLNDAYPIEIADDIDTNYAETLEDDFKAAGIMHLMAVSGGHFVLIAAAVMRAASFALLPRWAKASGVIGAYGMLTILMFPADSVLRAFVMGLFPVAAMLFGRRSQAMSALNWTVILLLMFDPSLAVSFGFALSCASVYGIVLLVDPMSRALLRYMPKPLAYGVAMTLAAQCFTLPIQVLMSPSIPIWSVPANCFAAPVVAVSTIAGLASLTVSWALPTVGFALAWLASLGTWLLERCATLFGGDHALAWPEGVPGMILVCAAETVLALTFWGIPRLLRVVATASGRMAPGEYRPGPAERVTCWWRQTCKMLFPR
ncbi:competence protein [Bifidobacterium margollesii]|uniref:Competence protein n=1 Tax=Bifidobacterium margollesii TaxID=2020964 RepID=A0A2N5J7Y8_9BIFI|nr:ComEC/Rec2 family competence protein [Bifidobacterium margollesii]PLS30307.1 competence protein [Bifidobacterium margollesii]